MLEKPVPMPAAFQATAGPLVGHCLRRPVSADWASRRAPRNWFQSRLAALGSVLVAWKREQQRRSRGHEEEDARKGRKLHDPVSYQRPPP
jgi:hypothetical protein